MGLPPMISRVNSYWPNLIVGRSGSAVAASADEGASDKIAVPAATPTVCWRNFRRDVARGSVPEKKLKSCGFMDAHWSGSAFDSNPKANQMTRDSVILHCLPPRHTE